VSYYSGVKHLQVLIRGEQLAIIFD
jgi:hypothetical protein